MIEVTTPTTPEQWREWAFAEARMESVAARGLRILFEMYDIRGRALSARIDRDCTMYEDELEMEERWAKLRIAENRDLLAEVERLTKERDDARTALFNIRMKYPDEPV